MKSGSTTGRCLTSGIVIEEGLHPLIEVFVESLRELLQALGSRLGSLILLICKRSLFGLDSLFERSLEIDEVLDELLGCSRIVDPFDECLLKRLILGQVKQPTRG